MEPTKTLSSWMVPVALLAGILLIWVAKPILVPLLLAILLAQLLAPLVRRLEKVLPTGLAAFLALALVVTVLACLLALLSGQLTALQDSLPAMQERVADSMSALSAYLSKHFGMGRANRLTFFSRVFETSISAGGSVAVSAFRLTLATALNMTLILIMTFLLLYYRRHLRWQLKLFTEEQHMLRFGEVINRVAEVGQSYVAGLVSVIALVGILDTLGFFLVGAPYPMLFGLCGALAVLIPYIGILIMAPLCLLLTYASSGSWQLMSGVALVYAVVHFLEGNVISPVLVGRKVDLNPLATILAVLIGGELWGPAGMLLFIPITGIFKLALELSPAGEALGRMLGPVGPVPGRSQNVSIWGRWRHHAPRQGNI